MVTNSTKSTTPAFGDKREMLLRAAARCFNEKGYSGTSLKDVSQQLGLTDAAIYYYIDGKQQLVYECYKRAAAIGKAALDHAIEAGGCGFEIANGYLERHVAAHCGAAGPIAIMSEIPSLRPTDREHILQLSREHSSRFEKVLEKGIDDGSIRDCDVRMTGNAIMGAINWIPKWFHGDMQTAARVEQTFSSYLMRGLAP